MLFSKSNELSLSSIAKEILEGGEASAEAWWVKVDNKKVLVQHICGNSIQEVFVQDLYVWIEKREGEIASLYYNRNCMLNLTGPVPLNIVLYKGKNVGIDIWQKDYGDCKDLEKQVACVQIYLSIDDVDVIFSHWPAMAPVARKTIAYTAEKKLERGVVRHLITPLASKIICLQKQTRGACKE